MAKQRQAWLDYVRFFSIFLVIVFHTPPRLPLFDDAVILNLRVPVFFCISGFLYSFDKWKSFGQYARHRSKQILVPYVTFFAIFYAAWLLLGRDMGGASETVIPQWQPLWEFLLGDPKTVVAPFWYIACLFSIQLLYYGVEKTAPRRWVFAVCCAIALAAYALLESPLSGSSFQWWRFWNIGNALQFLPFYALGNSFKPMLSQLTFKSAPRAAGFFLLAAVSMTGMAWVAPLQQHDYAFYSLIRVPAGLMLIPAYFCTAKWLASKFGRNKVIEFVVVSGTVYLGMQNYLIAISKTLLNHFIYPGVMDGNTWIKFAVSLAVMASIYPFAWLIDRYAPWLIGKGKFFDRW